MQAGLTQAKLGELVGKDRRTIGRLEQGKWQIQEDLAIALRAVLFRVIARGNEFTRRKPK